MLVPDDDSRYSCESLSKAALPGIPTAPMSSCWSKVPTGAGWSAARADVTAPTANAQKRAGMSGRWGDTMARAYDDMMGKGLIWAPPSGFDDWVLSDRKSVV